MTNRARVPAANIISFAIAAAVVAVVPWILPPYISFELAYAGAYAIAILGLVILTGMNGQASLGHGAFMAVGGYAVAIAVSRAGWPPEAAILIAAVLCAIFGWLVGMVALRLSGAYLALATFALAVSVAPVLKRFKDATGGAQGLTFSTAHAPGALATVLDNERWLYYEAWLLVGVLFAASWFALQGRLGRALRAIRDNEIAAVSFGINPAFYKALAFAWSAAYAGIAGALIANATAFVSPDTYALNLSITLLIGGVLGGLGSMWGAIVGGFVVEFLPLWAQNISTAASPLIYGISLIVVMIAVPGGIVGAIQRVAHTITRPRAEGKPERST
jgi:branched-chain amino acid transport system permease protein